MQGNNISTMADNISTVEGIQYCGEIASVLWGITSVNMKFSFSTVGTYLQYCGGCSVQWEIKSVHWGIA